LFTAKLKEYWQLTRVQKTQAVTASPIEDTQDNPRARIPTGASRTELAAQRPWPDVAGGELADRIRAFSGQTMPQQQARSWPPESSQTPGVQNVFHIELKNESGGDGSLADLSDKIADILREQALNQGIDIT
jgi:hypothetical protein